MLVKFVCDLERFRWLALAKAPRRLSAASASYQVRGLKTLLEVVVVAPPFQKDGLVLWAWAGQTGDQAAACRR